MKASILALPFLALPIATIAGDKLTFKKEKEVPLAGGSFDYVSVDAASRRVLVAHSTKVDVVDADKYEKLGEVPGVEGRTAR